MAQGQLSFDDIGSAMVAIFEIMTLEGWNDIMYAVQDVAGYWSFVYFVVLVFVGPIFGIQLFLVVISNKFAETKAATKAEKEKMANEAKLKKQASAGTMSMGGGSTWSVHNGSQKDGTDGYSSNPSFEEREELSNENSDGHHRKKNVKSVSEPSLAPVQLPPPMLQRGPPTQSGVKPKNTTSDDRKDEGKPQGMLQVMKKSISHTFMQAVELFADDSTHASEHSTHDQTSDKQLVAQRPGLQRAAPSGASLKSVEFEEGTKTEAASKHGVAKFDDNTRSPRTTSPGGSLSRAGSVNTGKHSKQRSGWRLWRWKLRLFAKSDVLQNTILIVIVFNTVFMMMDHDCDFCEIEVHGNPGGVPLVGGFNCATFKGILESSNLFFTTVFFLEMGIKIGGLGFVAYAKSPINWLDGFVVVTSIIELSNVVSTYKCFLAPAPPNPDCKLLGSQYDECSGGPSMSVLRTFRLVRIVKLLRAFPEIQKQVRILLAVLGSVGALNVLMSIFIIIFCLMGMNLFGGKMATEDIEVSYGAKVYVLLPDDPLAIPRYAQVLSYNRSRVETMPWEVEVRWGEEMADLLGLAADGTVQATAEPGMQNYATIVASVPRLNFDDFWISLVTTFQLLSLANWNDVRQDAIASTNAAFNLYFFILIIVGNWMLLNLFIAILVQGFAEQRADQQQNNLMMMQDRILEELGGLEEEQLAYRLSELFNAIDVDKSNFIDRYELKAALEQLGIFFTAKGVADLMRKYDEDNSGSIDFDEFLTMILEIISDARKAVDARSKTNVKDGEKEKKPIKTENEENGSRTPKKQPLGTARESPSRDVSGVWDRRSSMEAPRTSSSDGVAPAIPSRRNSNQNPVSDKPCAIPVTPTGSLDRPMGAQVSRCLMQPPVPSRLDLGSPEIQSRSLSRDNSTKSLLESRKLSRDGSTTSMDSCHAGGGMSVNGSPSMRAQRSLDTGRGSRRRSDVNQENRSSPVMIGQQKRSTSIVAMRMIHDEEVRRREEEKKLHGEDLEPKVKVPRVGWCLPTDSAPSKFSQQVADHKHFKNVILGCILVSCICLAVEAPSIGEGTLTREILDWADLVTSSFFILECVLKILGHTFLGYIASNWNRLDFLIVTTSLADLIMSRALQGQDVDIQVFKVFRVFRIFRALRPLRIIARAKGLRVLVSTLLSAVRPVLNTTGIALAVFSVFGVLGMQLLSGKMRRCTDPTVFDRRHCIGFDDDGNPREWVNADNNFDNMYRAVMSIFILATQDDWPIHMWAGVDATAKLTGPKQNHNLPMMLFYVVSIVLASYLVVNIFVGVFVDCYTMASGEMIAERLREQKTHKKLTNVKEVFDDPKDPWRMALYKIVTATWFDFLIAFFIISNVVCMGMETYQPGERWVTFGEVNNFFFSFIFGWECFGKLAALYPRRYFASNWNRFDFFIVSVTYLGILIDASARIAAASTPSDGGPPSEPPNLMFLRIQRIFRIFRILRAVRIFKTAKGLYTIAVTMMSSLPALVNLLMMLMLLFFMYGVLGVMLFGHLCSAGDESRPGIEAVRCMLHQPETLLDPHANFYNIGNALLTLFRIATGDAWGEILYACQVEVVGGFPRKVLEETWAHLVDLLKYDPRVLSPQDPRFLAADDDDAALKIAMLSVRRWNETAYGTEDHPEWPISSDTARDWVGMARMALPYCVTDHEMAELEKAKLADCGEGIRCVETCGNPYFANLTLVTFVLVAAFILLQLVIAVLMEQLANQFGQDLSGRKRPEDMIPGCEVLQKPVFARMARRWLYNAERVLAESSPVRIMPAIQEGESEENLSFIDNSRTRNSNSGRSLSPAAHEKPQDDAMGGDAGTDRQDAVGSLDAMSEALHHRRDSGVTG
uniref:EF-hand domain-containing protein n=1 Tax=Hemiselmis tepida TaxID=464990 RepID=A0A7S0VSM7_9CRYP